MTINAELARTTSLEYAILARRIIRGVKFPRIFGSFDKFCFEEAISEDKISQCCRLVDVTYIETYGWEKTPVKDAPQTEHCKWLAVVHRKTDLVVATMQFLDGNEMLLPIFAEFPQMKKENCGELSRLAFLLCMEKGEEQNSYGIENSRCRKAFEDMDPDVFHALFGGVVELAERMNFESILYETHGKIKDMLLMGGFPMEFVGEGKFNHTGREFLPFSMSTAVLLQGRKEARRKLQELESEVVPMDNFFYPLLAN